VVLPAGRLGDLLDGGALGALEHFDHFRLLGTCAGRVFLTDIEERPAINPRRIAYFGNHRPASTLVGVSALIDPRLKVEIECQAYVSDDAG
jgi:hypothetical protein